MPAGGFWSLGGNRRNTDAVPKGFQTGRCDCDVYGKQRQRKESDLKEVERIKELITRLEQQSPPRYHPNHKRACSAMANNNKDIKTPTLDDSSDGLEARMRTEFVMIKSRLRKMEKELQQLGSTRLG